MAMDVPAHCRKDKERKTEMEIDGQYGARLDRELVIG